MLNMNDIIKTHDLVFLTLDTLRYDIAQSAWKAGEIPNFEQLLGKEGWEKRHTPGSFTYAAHHAFFSGFLPTPVNPGRHPRHFAARFPGSETTVSTTFSFEDATFVEALSVSGFTTICVGGVGFFNQQSKLGNVFPSLFDISHWDKNCGVTDKNSTQNQFQWMCDAIQNIENQVFSFVNISAIHQPNFFYIEGQASDDIHSHRAALAYVDSQLPILLSAFKKRKRDSFWILCSDHGTTYGDDNYYGHRLAHSKVWTVPYAEFFVKGKG